MKRLFSILLTLLIIFVSCSESNPTIDKLHAEKKVSNAYHFYPSTLRMLNFVDVESINKLVKNIDQMVVMRMDQDVFDREQLRAFSSEMQENENYEVYMEMTNEGAQYSILGKDKEEKTLLLINMEAGQYVVDIDGMPDLIQIPRVLDEINSLDSTKRAGFDILLDVMDQDARMVQRRKDREKRMKKREQADQLNAQPKPTSTDSLTQDTLKN